MSESLESDELLVVVAVLLEAIFKESERNIVDADVVGNDEKNVDVDNDNSSLIFLFPASTSTSWTFTLSKVLEFTEVNDNGEDGGDDEVDNG